MKRMNMPKLKVLCIFCLGILMMACDAAPTDKFAGGGGLNLKDERGSWLLINYWAEWCAPCREEIPELNELHAEREDLKLHLMGVNYDGIRDAALAEVIEKMGIAFPVLTEDPRKYWEVELPQVLPVTLVISPQGKLIANLVGPQTKASLLAVMQQ